MWLVSKMTTLGFVPPIYKEHLKHKYWHKTIDDTWIPMTKVKNAHESKYVECVLKVEYVLDGLNCFWYSTFSK